MTTMSHAVLEGGDEVRGAATGEQLRRVGRRGPGGEDLERVEPGHGLHRVFEAALAEEHRGEAHRVREVEEVVHAWPAKVAVDQHHAEAGAGERHRHVRAGGGLAVLGEGARDLQAVDGSLEAGEIRTDVRSVR